MANRQPVQNDEQVDLWINQISGIYHQLSLDLFDSMVDRLRLGGAADLERNPYIWQLEKLNDMHMLNEENLELIAERSGIAKDLLKKVIEHEGFKVYRTTKQQLAEDLKFGITSMDYGVQFALSAYYTQAERELDSLINTTLPQSVRNNYEKIVVQSVAEVVTGTKTAEQALNDTLVKWFDNGFYGFTDARGRRWSADSYARTIIKSTTYRTYNEMRMRPAEELGIDTFYYSIKMCAREMCAPIQNRIVTTGLTRDIKGITVLSVMDYGYGTPAGCRGINCGHMMTPFIPGVNNMPELPDYLKGLTPEQAVMNAKAEAKQRSFERRIRKNKEKLHVAKKLGDKERVQKYKLREKTLRSGLKAFLDEHKFLHRDTSRERYRVNAESAKKVEKQFRRKDDVKEYKRLVRDLGKDRVPESMDKFVDIKYNKGEAYRKLKEQAEWAKAEFPSEKSLDGHYQKHGNEFSDQVTKKEYQRMAADLLSKPVSENILGYDTEEGRRVRYDKENNVMAIGKITAKGKHNIKTILKPEKGEEYYRENSRKDHHNE